ncbi:MAG TPA: hypothetical protein VFK23_01675 [Nitrospirota bacterium]|nr:hypothetical protein [Nitrospirota bacterium]
MLDEGRQTFRFDTFGSEDFWGGTLKLHSAISGTANGGVGAGVSPATALSVGLKVDLDALPADLVTQLKNGTVNLNDPATTLALLKLNAVVGVTGFFDAAGKLTSLGIQCAFCHSTVDDALVPGIGHRLDGWNNQDLNVGAIVNLSPDLTPVATLLSPALPGITQDTVRTVLQSWGPGKFDAELFMDGKAFNTNQTVNSVVTGTNVPAATLIPPAYGLAGVNLHTSAGWGSVTYWNAFVGNLEMHGKGTFFDPRLNNPTKYPVATAAGFFNVRSNPDLVTSKLASLQMYQLNIPAPTPPAGSFDAAAADRGKLVFNGKGQCATCHVPPLFTEPGWNMHTPPEVGVDSFQADRSPDGRYRTTPLKGLWSHMKRGFYHDGRFATLADVINHYDTLGTLGLTAQEKTDLAEYLKSI